MRTHTLVWEFKTERKDNEISMAHASRGYSIDCWPPDWYEVRKYGDSVAKCKTLHEAIQIAENDLETKR